MRTRKGSGLGREPIMEQERGFTEVMERDTSGRLELDVLGGTYERGRDVCRERYELSSLSLLGVLVLRTHLTTCPTFY
jgi:hypothetical protein